MKRVACLLGVFVACGPLVAPMPVRLADEDQKRVDQGWEKALAPVERVSREDWLDLLVGDGLFSIGVDKLYFRSEKRYSRGLVVMQVRFDRFDPAQDLFTMEVLDAQGRLVRREAYSRDDVTRTARALFRNEASEDDATRDAREKRWAKIHEFFPAKPSP